MVSEICEVRCCVGKKEGRIGHWTAKTDLFSGLFMYLSEKFNWETFIVACRAKCYKPYLYSRGSIFRAVVIFIIQN